MILQKRRLIHRTGAGDECRTTYAEVLIVADYFRLIIFISAQLYSTVATAVRHLLVEIIHNINKVVVVVLKVHILTAL